MKRVVSMLLISVFLLNIFGLYGIFIGLRTQLAGEVRKTLNENDYALGDEITFKVPLAIPYATDGQEYERVDGEFEHDGAVYRLVKQKMIQDTLYIVCVKDSRTQKMDKALQDYVKTFSDKPSSEKGPAKTLVNFSKDFISHIVSLETHQSGWELTFSSFSTSSGTVASASTDIIQPPKI